MLNHAFLNDQIGFCTWPVLTTALVMPGLEPAPSLNAVWCKAKQSLSFSLCFCSLKASSPRWDPLFLPECYGNHRQLHFCSPAFGLYFCLHMCPDLVCGMGLFYLSGSFLIFHVQRNGWCTHF